LEHLQVLTDSRKSDCATRAHIANDDPTSGWICDFGPFKRVAAKRQTAVGDVFSKTRVLASKRLKSGLDAWGGFNQAAERASRLARINTSMGLLQRAVLAVGVTHLPMGVPSPLPPESLRIVFPQTSESLEFWRFRSKFGSLGVWKFGSLVVWKFGSLEV
jgi:hypothetical protein